MTEIINSGDCVRLHDGRIGRIREIFKKSTEFEYRRKNSKNHQVIKVTSGDITRIQCPKGWMSPDGYNRYLKQTLSKMKKRMN